MLYGIHMWKEGGKKSMNPSDSQFSIPGPMVKTMG
jgi:hypothetical protein